MQMGNLLRSSRGLACREKRLQPYINAFDTLGKIWPTMANGCFGILAYPSTSPNTYAGSMPNTIILDESRDICPNIDL